MSVHKYIKADKTYWYVKYKNKTFRGFKTKRDALNHEAKLKLNEDMLSKATYLHVVIQEYLSRREKELCTSSLRKLKKAMEFVIQNTKDKDIHDIDEVDCRNFRDAIYETNYSTSHKNYLLKEYKALFKYLVTYHKLKHSPTYVLRQFKNTHEETLKKKENEKNIWTEEEFMRFLEHINYQIYREFFTILYYTGLRLGEALALTWKDFDGKCFEITKSLSKATNENNYIIKSPKTASSIRVVPLGDDLSKMMNKFKTQRMEKKGFNEDWFVFGDRIPLKHTTITRIKDKAIKEANVRPIRIHDFRHSHASDLIGSGINMVAVSNRLGHSNVSTTLKTYTHLIDKADKELLNHINKSSQNLLKEFY